MDPQNLTTENGALIELMSELDTVGTMQLDRGTADKAEVLVVPKGKEVVSVKKYLDEYRERPERREGTAHLTTLQSFVDHVNRFKDGDSAVFADVTGGTPRLIAVLDYHEQNDRSQVGERGAMGVVAGRPRFGRHRAEYRFPISKEWEAWTAAGKKGLTQLEFAEFLEDHLVDVLDPAAAGPDGKPLVGETARKLASLLGITLANPQRLLELSRGLSVHVGAAVKVHPNLSSGETHLSFEEKHSDGKGEPLKIPGGFVIGIPVFRDGESYQLPVRLRYRVQGTNVNWFIALQRADQAYDHAVTRCAGGAKAATELPLFFGTPET